MMCEPPGVSGSAEKRVAQASEARPRRLRRALFVDRDGVLVRHVPGDIATPQQVTLVPGAAAALRRARDAGLVIVLISNQAKVGRGEISTDDLDRIHRRLLDLLERDGASLDAAYYCVHAPDAGCDCRKPRPGSLIRAAAEHGLDLRRSLFVGDDPRDVLAANAAGAAAGVVLTGHLSSASVQSVAPPPQFIATDLPQLLEAWVATWRR
jgi:D-glycero-D-manno-heptose 1,7-bisphosphate phosphatase